MVEKLGFIILQGRRIRNDLIETFKIINGFSNYGRQFFNISSRTENLLSRQTSKTKYSNQMNSLCL